ncbi:proton-coupled zinc antiporter SLC30A8 [Discoglossus pictus]
MKGLEKAYLVTEKAIKMYSLNSVSSEQNNIIKEKLQDEEIPQSNDVYHCHNCNIRAYDARQKEQKAAKKKLYIAAVICLTFTIAEIVGGYIAGSLAVVTDGAHLLVDLSSFLLSICSLWLSAKPATKDLNYGWYRAEIVGAFLSMVTVWVLTGVLVYLASERLVHQDYEINGTVMLITSSCALLANIILACLLRTSGHGHSHGLSHGHSHELGEADSKSQPKAQHNASIRAAYIHVLGDLFQSISVLISSIIIYFKPKYKIADPICTFIFSLFVVATTIKILIDVFIVLMEGRPRGIEYADVQTKILSVEGVQSVHSLHLWSLTMNIFILSAHVTTESDPAKILKAVTQKVYDNFPFYSVTIQVEPAEEQKPECIFCSEPKK